MVKNFKKKPNVFKGESNPFNMKINREKRCILGQSKAGTKGLRGISRAECYDKRKKLWQKTRVIAEKTNKFTDKRLMDGSEESRINRLVQERTKKLKKNIYNLNEESLTHNGMPLDVTQSGGKESDSDEEDQLDATFVNKAHFGGPSDAKSSDPKSQKEILEELIVESKKKKYEKKMEKEETDDLTEDLDRGWKDFLSVVGKIKCMEPKSAFEKPDPYTVLTNQLKFDKRGNPAGRTKTEEELELEEKERLRKLEVERLARMNNDGGQKPRNVVEHVSADSIFDDDFDLEPIVGQENADEKPDAQSESEYSDSEEEESEEEEDNVEVADEVEDEKEESDDMHKNLPIIPSNIAAFEKYVNTRNFTPETIYTAVEDILKPYLKAKSEKILKKLAAFFGVLIEYALKHLDTNIAISGEIVPHLHTIAELCPLDTAEVFLKYLDKEQQAYQESKKLKGRKGFPSLQSLLILKYCSVLYSVSDYRHSVVTPAFVFMCDILSSTFPVTLSNITSRLFVCSIIVDCVSLSKRFAPDAINFLNETLRLALPSQTKKTSKQTKIKEINLVFHSKDTCNEVTDIDIFNIDKSVVNATMKSSIIFKSVNLLHQFASLYKHLPSYPEIFSETVSICSKLPASNYVDILKDSINNLIADIKSTNVPLRHLVYQNKKPKPLKMFEPSFDSKFDKKEEVNIKKKFAQIKEVSKKIKREEKCILRDMRRDAEMIATEKLKERMESDAERKRKVKELYHDLATQEGEYKKMMKKKPT